jgi:DNA-binding NarL/FixJ family response regulator
MQPCDRLTSKEVQVATLVWAGHTNREIADVVGTTEQVIKNYLRNTFDKLGVWSRLELALYVANHGGEQWRDAPQNLESADQSAVQRFRVAG